MGPNSSPEKSVTNYPPTLRNIPQDLRPQRQECKSLKSRLISVYSKNLTKLINALCERSQDLVMLNLAVCKVIIGLQMVHISLMTCYKGKSCALCTVRCTFIWTIQTNAVEPADGPIAPSRCAVLIPVCSCDPFPASTPTLTHSPNKISIIELQPAALSLRTRWAVRNWTSILAPSKPSIYR
jgi:hypothetical protein